MIADLCWHVLANSAMCAAIAAILRELFADRHIHWAARFLGLTSWLVLASYSWTAALELRSTMSKTQFADTSVVNDANVEIARNY